MAVRQPFSPELASKRAARTAGSDVSEPLIIAIDGPAAAGKRVLARRLAATLGLPYLDTGLLYRATGRRVLDSGGDPAEPGAAVFAAQALTAADLGRSDLHGPVADAAAAAVGAVPAVRAALLNFQRGFAEHGAVLSGRDIGTVVSPDAPVKLYLTASLATRAHRRWTEFLAEGIMSDLATVEAELLARDTRDAPNMQRATDALILDTTALDADMTFKVALFEVRHKLGLSEAPLKSDVADLEDTTDSLHVVEQRPAAYRFIVRGEGIDVLPEPPEPEHREFALDSYNELINKAQTLRDRLCRTDSADRVVESIERLLAALAARFDELRPGVLLSRVRSIEADRGAFDTHESRRELFPDAIAMMDDVLHTARDLLNAFPIVRRIEAERIALDVQRNLDALPLIEQETSAISKAAAESGKASAAALNALRENDAAMNAATDPVLRASLAGDKLLVIRNFSGAIVGKIWEEIGGLGSATWLAVKEELPRGIGVAARVAPLMALAVMISGPAGGLAAVVPAFKPLAGMLGKLARADSKSASVVEQPLRKRRARRNNA